MDFAGNFDPTQTHTPLLVSCLKYITDHTVVNSGGFELRFSYIRFLPPYPLGHKASTLRYLSTEVSQN